MIIVVIHMTPSNIEFRFHDEMLEIYQPAKAECHYNARLTNTSDWESSSFPS